LLEDVMHEGRVPGFYDGQFSALFALDDSVYRRLLATALDPRVTYVARARSVLALHEARRPTLEVELQPLFVSPTVEFEFPDQIFLRSRIETEDVLVYCACKLSQYARFSCAKAGLSRPIDAKIRTLESIATRRLRSAEGLKPAVALAPELLGAQAEGAADDLERAFMYRLNEAMDTFFELGYHHQQLDDYVRAELEYRKITERPEAVRVKSWAYYNLACIRAIEGRTEDAIAEMGRAVDSGFTDVSWARRDGDLASIRTDPRFHAILRRAEGG
ncbi:MAG: TPR end-of-group domain-containing protein, partial [Planctomycetota bacterium JB042]